MLNCVLVVWSWNSDVYRDKNWSTCYRISARANSSQLTPLNGPKFAERKFELAKWSVADLLKLWLFGSWTAAPDKIGAPGRYRWNIGPSYRKFSLSRGFSPVCNSAPGDSVKIIPSLRGTIDLVEFQRSSETKLISQLNILTVPTHVFELHRRIVIQSI